MAAQLHFAVGHFPVTAAQDFLEIVRNRPEVSGASAKTPRIEVGWPLTKAGTGRSKAAVRKIVHWDCMTQARFGILFEQTEEAMQFPVAQLLQLFTDLAKLAIGPFFEALEPFSACTGGTARAKASREAFGDEAFQIAERFRENIFARFAFGRWQVIERFGSDFLRGIAEKIVHRGFASENDGSQWRQRRLAVAREIPLLVALEGHLEQIPDVQGGIVVEMTEAESGVEKSDWPWAEFAKFGIGYGRMENGVGWDVETTGEEVARDAGGRGRGWVARTGNNQQAGD
jgi:hypothetical protein